MLYVVPKWLSRMLPINSIYTLSLKRCGCVYLRFHQWDILYASNYSSPSTCMKNARRYAKFEYIIQLKAVITARHAFLRSIHVCGVVRRSAIDVRQYYCCVQIAFAILVRIYFRPLCIRVQAERHQCGHDVYSV